MPGLSSGSPTRRLCGIQYTMEGKEGIHPCTVLDGLLLDGELAL